LGANANSLETVADFVRTLVREIDAFAIVGLER